MSAKNQRELASTANSLPVEVLKIQRIFDIRWVFSLFGSVKAVLRDHEALIVHFTQCANSDWHSKEKANSTGWHKSCNCGVLLLNRVC